MKKKEQKQIDVNHPREGIGPGLEPAGWVEGEQWEGKWESEGRENISPSLFKGWGALRS
jgi:hypothetical protein